MCVCMHACVSVFMHIHVHVYNTNDIDTTLDKDSMVDTAVLMEPPSSGKLLKTASFSDEGAL